MTLRNHFVNADKLTTNLTPYNEEDEKVKKQK